MIKYPRNVGSNYTVKLASPLNFSGQTLNDDTRWQVSMLSLHYNFFNFHESCTLRFIVDKPANVVASETASPDCRDADNSGIDIADIMTDEATTFWTVREHRRVTMIAEWYTNNVTIISIWNGRSTKGLLRECQGTVWVYHQ